MARFLTRSSLDCATGALLALLGTAATMPAAGADPVADFYNGKTITILVGFGAGGGYDTTTRCLHPISASTFPAIPISWCRTCPAPAR